MNDGLVAFERVRDWEALACQRHICEIQGYEPDEGSDVHMEPLFTPLPAERLGASRATGSFSRDLLCPWSHCSARSKVWSPL